MPPSKEQHPVEQLRRWYEEAQDAGIVEPDAMTLATASAAGHPSARLVLMKGYDRRGILFSTNYASRKAQELAENPWASVVFYWQPLHRQVRVEGRVERASAEESDRIFAARPRGAQLSAWASRQSQEIPDREPLGQAVGEAQRRFPDEVARPEFWGAYRLKPDRFEFWEGREDRLHDRLCFVRESDGKWRAARLAP